MDKAFKTWVDAVTCYMKSLGCERLPQPKEFLQVWNEFPEAVRGYFEQESKGARPSAEMFTEQPDCDLSTCDKWSQCEHWGACVDTYVMADAAGWWMLINDFIPVQTEPVTVGGYR